MQQAVSQVKFNVSAVGLFLYGLALPRDTLAGKSAAQSPGDRLTGQNGWKEIDGCPLYTNDDFPVAVQQMEDILGKYPQLDAFVPTGGFPQFVPQAYRKVAEKVTGVSGEIDVVVHAKDVATPSEPPVGT